MTRQTSAIGIGLGLLLAPIAFAATPTMSLKASAVNGIPVAGGLASRIVALPGDVIEVKMVLRDWSPEGQMLRSYQGTLDSSSFTSGDSGRIEPVGYSGGTVDNSANVTLGEGDPAFIHKGFHILPVIQAQSPDYKWISVIFETGQGPVSAQDGREYVCGVVPMQVSDGASGTFHLALFEDPEMSLILDPSNQKIEPVAFETLLVDVAPIGKWARIASSDPPYGAIDARVAPDLGRSDWRSVTVTSSADADQLSPSDFEVSDGSDAPPRITSIETNGGSATLRFDRGIRAGAWTTIVHSASASLVRIGFLPGDVNNDGAANSDDVLALIGSMNAPETSLPAYREDLNADGARTVADLAALIHALADPQSRQTSIAK